MSRDSATADISTDDLPICNYASVLKKMDEDKQKYLEIVQKCEMLDDLPPRRLKKIEKPPKKAAPKKARAKRATRKATKPESSKKESKTEKTTGIKKPSYYHKVQEHKKKSPNEFLKKKAQSYEDHFLVNNSYEKMIETLKNAGTESIDFGMLWKLLPKNLEFENNRFSLEQNDKGLRSFIQSQKGHPFSADIDRFLQLLDDMASSEPQIL